VPQIMSHFPSLFRPIHYSPMLLSFDAAYGRLLKEVVK